MNNGRGYSFYIVEEEGTLNVFFFKKKTQKNKIVFRFGSHCQGVKMSGQLQNKCAPPFLQLSVSSLHINQRRQH